MSKTLSFTCMLVNGVHARPASHIETLCNGFGSAFQWHNGRTDRVADGKSVLSLIGADILFNDECLVTIEGNDEDAAYRALAHFIEYQLPHCDEALPEHDESAELEPLPESLSHLSPLVFRARSVSEGCASGKLVSLSDVNLATFRDLPASQGKDKEQSLLCRGLAGLEKSLNLQLMAGSGTMTAVLESHLSLLRDNSLREALLSRVAQDRSCAQSIVDTAAYFSSQLAQSSSAYLRERELDIRDVSFRLLQQIYGEERFPSQQALSEASICLADELTPSQFLELDKTHLKGLLLGSGGSTSHTVILARSFNIPTLVGVDPQPLLAYLQQDVLIDGDLGLIACALSEPVRRYYCQEQAVQQALRGQQSEYLDKPGYTADGVRLEVAANIAHSVEASAAFDHGAEAIGLFRTEMLYMDRASALPKMSCTIFIVRRRRQPGAKLSLSARWISGG